MNLQNCSYREQNTKFVTMVNEKQACFYPVQKSKDLPIVSANMFLFL